MSDLTVGAAAHAWFRDRQPTTENQASKSHVERRARRYQCGIVTRSVTGDGGHEHQQWLEYQDNGLGLRTPGPH